jgi:hypothetical protein
LPKPSTLESVRAIRFIRDFITHYFLARYVYRVDPNGTHDIFLRTSILHLLETTQSDQSIYLLEFGTGGKSSQIMREFMEENNRIKLFSFENSVNWLNKHKNLYSASQRHELIYVVDEGWVESALTVLNLIPKGQISLAFIDSFPWSSRSSLVSAIGKHVDILLVHDVDYFPHNKIFGTELTPIQYRKTGVVRYGKLVVSLLGERNYDDVANFWVEAFPDEPGYYTGPPTLIASDIVDVRSFTWPNDTIRFSSVFK